jgi:hypothetical protein
VTYGLGGNTFLWIVFNSVEIYCTNNETAFLKIKDRNYVKNNFFQFKSLVYMYSQTVTELKSKWRYELIPCKFHLLIVNVSSFLLNLNCF